MHHHTDKIAHTTAFVTPVGRGTLAGTRNSSMGPSLRIDPTTHRTTSERSYHGATSRSSCVRVYQGYTLYVGLSQKGTSPVPVSGTGKGKQKRDGGGGGGRLHWRVHGSTSSPTVVGSRRRVFRVLWNLEYPVGLSQKGICAHFSEGILAQFGRFAPKH